MDTMDSSTYLIDDVDSSRDGGPFAGVDASVEPVARLLVSFGSDLKEKRISMTVQEHGSEVGVP